MEQKPKIEAVNPLQEAKKILEGARILPLGITVGYAPDEITRDYVLEMNKRLAKVAELLNKI